MQRKYLKLGESLKLNDKNYTINSVLGDGANCIVYSATYKDNMGFSHRVNIKECYPYNAKIIRDESVLVWELNEEKEFFFDSFKTAYKKLLVWQDENEIINILDICEANNTQYVVMEPNKKCVTFDKDNPKTLVDILKTIKTLAYYIEKYHQNGYLHLDIKPSNFLVYPRPSDHIVLFDIDTVTAISDIENGRYNYVSYSEGWASPEQKQAKTNKFCPATDIYAIGAVLFEKIMGRQLNNDDIGYFAEWSFEGDLFEKINPKIKRLLTRIFRKTLAANIKRRYQAADELIADLQEAIKVAESKIYLMGDDICCSGCFVGREKELSLIKESFDSKKKAVFLHGFGGIGKTEIARKYAEINGNNYDTILFVKYNENDSLKKQISESLVNYETDDIGDKWRGCCELLDRDCLIIVDNFDVDYEKADELNDLFESKACFLISTRTDFSKFYTGKKYSHIEVKQLVNDKLEQVFKRNAQISDFSESDREILFKIFVLIENHTYATELLAKQMFYSGWSLEFLYRKVKAGLKNLENSESIYVNKDGKPKEDNSFNILRAVYNISELAEDQKQVLRNLSLLNCVKMTRETYRQITQAESLEPLNKLLKLGLIQNEGENFYLHALIDELVRIEFELDWDNCIQAYNYVLRMVDEFNYQHIYVMDVPGQEELEFKAEFLSRFFRSVDLLYEANMKLVLRWLNYIFSEENDFWFACAFHPKIKYDELLPKIVEVIKKIPFL